MLRQHQTLVELALVGFHGRGQNFVLTLLACRSLFDVVMNVPMHVIVVNLEQCFHLVEGDFLRDAHGTRPIMRSSPAHSVELVRVDVKLVWPPRHTGSGRHDDVLLCCRPLFLVQWCLDARSTARGLCFTAPDR